MIEFLVGMAGLIFCTVLVPVLAVVAIRRLLSQGGQETSRGAQAPAGDLLQRLNRIEARLERLEAVWPGLSQAPGAQPPAAPPSRPVPGLPPPPSGVVAAARAEAVSRSINAAGPEAMPRPKAPAPPPARPPGRSLGQRLEQGIENWTGRLGAAAVVAGVTFLLLHSAYRLEPAQRFLMTLLAAAALGGVSFWLGRKPGWRELSEWIRGAAGAIALLACAAAGGLPGLGLQWIDQPLPALGLLLAGIAVNLLLAWRSRRQAIAAMHVVLCLLPWAIVPPSAMALGIASAIAVVGLALAHQRRWEGTLLSVTGAAALQQLFWYVQTDLPFRNESVRPAGLIAAVVVFSAGVLAVHARRPAPAHVAPMPLLSLLTSWTGLTLALLAYPETALGRSLGCGLAAGAAFGLARWAGRRGEAWLHRTERLITQSLLITALFSLAPVLANGLVLLLAVLLACLVFLRIAEDGGDGWLRRASRILVLGFGVVLALVGLIPAIGPSAWQNSATLMLGAAASAAASVDLARRSDDRQQRRPRPALGWLCGGLVISSSVQALEAGPMEWLALGAIGGLLLLARRLEAPGVPAGAKAAGLAVHGLSWLSLVVAAPWEAGDLSSRLLPLLLLGGVLLWAGQGRWGRQGAIVLLAVDLGLAAQLLLAPVSPWLPSLVWLLLALPVADLAARVTERTARTLLVVGLGYLLLVLIVWPLWVLPSSAVLGPVRVQVPLELLGLGVLLRWRQVSGRKPLVHHPAWQRVHPVLLEALLITLTLIPLWELGPLARSVAWSLLALVLASRSGVRQLTGRAGLYALPISWLGMAQLVAALRSIRLEGLAWTWAGHALVLGAVTLQVAFVVLHHRRDRPDAQGFPPALAALGAVLARANRQRLAAVDLPMLAGVALAIYWRVDGGLLTLLWSAQAFLVFSLSAWLRNNPLRHLALVGLGGCLLRLLTVDLARADLGLKGAVFLGVGILLLAMNAMVNRFSSRFN